MSFYRSIEAQQMTDTAVLIFMAIKGYGPTMVSCCGAWVPVDGPDAILYRNILEYSITKTYSLNGYKTEDCTVYVLDRNNIISMRQGCQPVGYYWNSSKTTVEKCFLDKNLNPVATY
jgi:hypothetical protein